MKMYLYKNFRIIIGLFCLFGINHKLQSASDVFLEGSSSRTLKILSYNICTQAQTFGTELDLEHRLPKILEMIRTNTPDVICLQEVRKKVAKSVASMLFKNGYITTYNSNNEDPMSLGLMTAYKPKIVFCDSHEMKWFSETPDVCSPNAWYEFGRIFTVSKFFPCDQKGMVDDDQEPFYVLNTHLGLAEEEKEYSALQLLAMMANFKRVVLVGDMNFFDDKRGQAQRKIYTDAELKDLLVNAHPTFVGYSYDKFIPKTKAEMPKLDGAFAKGVEEEEITVLGYDELEEDLSNRDKQPSDHLGILIKIAKK